MRAFHANKIHIGRIAIHDAASQSSNTFHGLHGLRAENAELRRIEFGERRVSGALIEATFVESVRRATIDLHIHVIFYIHNVQRAHGTLHLPKKKTDLFF
tara:strand:- start:2012 stop:2311 length:300 start_codon:yes stop_codon:yes gene_type:complete